jgi:hypothetical protein
MPADVLNFPDPADELEIELDPSPTTDVVAATVEAELELEPDIDVELEGEPRELASVSTALIEILPADFQLPLLTKFIPNPALRTAIDEAATYALSVAVTGPEGLQAADLALSTLRDTLKVVDAHFEDPTRIANDLHKRLTGIRSEWQANGKQASSTVGTRIATETRRLEQLAAEERRQAQRKADDEARAAAKRLADDATKANAPAAVVETLQREARTVTAPPVAMPVSAPPALKGSTVVSTWKARLKGTTGDQEPNPEPGLLTDAQRLQVLQLLKAIMDGRAPIQAIEVNWRYLNQRAKSDKGTLQIDGIEAFEENGVRAKPRGRA